MERLISLDALLRYSVPENPCGEYHANIDFVAGIETALEYAMNLPTVDAIPVEWINRWYEKYMYAEVGDLLNDWMAERKEHETD